MFGYHTLFETAQTDAIFHRLTECDRQVFELFNTVNFERVLRALRIAELINGCVGYDSAIISERYESIQLALFESIRHVHVPWSAVGLERLYAIRNCLSEYRYIYSTNYDLLTYWACMSKDDSRFRDYFWSNGRCFDMNNCTAPEEIPKMLFLHGALHLRQSASGTVRKIVATNDNLLEMSTNATVERNDEFPLFITEGTSEDKIRAIFQSPYLSFAFNQFVRHRGGLVVFGHSLSEADAHIVKTIASFMKNTPLAVSILPGNEEEILLKKAELRKMFRNTDLHTFDATTHPLGQSALSIRMSGT
jgi:Domain of unknown function (DUF4917)